MDSFGFLRSQLPPGFRFHPTDHELIIHYLRRRANSSPTPATSIIAELDLYKFNPWELPDKAIFGEGEWFFFSPRERKYPNGRRPNRAAGSGYWKATGVDKPIIAAGGSQCLGVKKALVFYQGRPPKGTKTDWVMLEYRLLDDKPSRWPHSSMRLDDWVLCRVRQKGSMPGETDEKPASTSANPSNNLTSNEHEILREGSKSIDGWSDHQLLAYLLGSHECTSEVLNSPESCSLENMASCDYVADSRQPSQTVSSVLASIKRTLSFGAFDEIMMQRPSKRLRYANVCDQPSAASSFSVDQFSPEFII